MGSVWWITLLTVTAAAVCQFVWGYGQLQYSKLQEQEMLNVRFAVSYRGLWLQLSMGNQMT